MKKGLLKIIVDIFVLIVILLVLDVIIGWTGEKYMRWLNHTPRGGDAAMVNFNVNAAVPDVAIIGSSTAICHYDPVIIHDSLMLFWGEDLEVLNMGVSNQRLAYDYYGLKCLLDRTTPKLVIVDVWASYLGEGDPSFSFEAFKPYTKINPRIKEMLISHKKYNFKYWSNMYCYNTEFVKLLMSIFKKGGANGFTKSKLELKEISKSFERDDSKLLPLSIQEFDSMISLSIQRDFPLFVVLSPTLRSADTTSLSYHYMKEKCMEYDIPFLDYSNDKSYYMPHYFRDNTHLNYFGAQRFTKQLMKDIKIYLTAK